MPNIFKTKAKDPTHAVIGQTLEGETYSIPISKGPHWLIAGQTGSGKSVMMNTILISMIAHAHPDELKITWIDPKKVEATSYVGLPYCPIDPITDMGDAYGLLAYAAWLMDERYEKLTIVKAKNIEDYNEFIAEKPEKAAELGLEPMPYWVIVIDEFADLMMQYREVEKNVIRLGQKARAAGIHLMITTQRPSADVFSPTIKANIPSRIGMKTADQINSMIIIDEGGCETLLGYGDSLVKTASGEITRVQGPFIDNNEIEAIFKHLRDNYDKPAPIDYKSVTVEHSLTEWAEEYEEDVPIEKRHVKMPRMGRFGR